MLLATDGQARTDATARVARRVAERCGRPVEALAVLQPLPWSLGGDGVPAWSPDLESARAHDLQTTADRRLAPLLGDRADRRVEVRYGDPAAVIDATARERDAALIVMGSGSHGWMDRLLGEEVSLHVVRHADRPVLAVAPQATGRFRRIVVGIDFSAASIRAAQTALQLLEPPPDGQPAACELGDDGSRTLTLVHVRAVDTRVTPLTVAWDAQYVADVGAMFVRLRALLRSAAPPGVTIATRVRTGSTVACLREAAQEADADLVALGTHGPGWVERLMVGSVAAGALRELPTCVLITPVPDAAERVRLELRVAGQVTLDQPGDWPAALDEFTRRNLGRRARLEVSGAVGEALTESAVGFSFQGATFDRHDRRLALMLDDPADHARHLTHAVTRVRSLDLVGEDGAADRALLVDYPGGEAVLTFVG